MDVEEYTSNEILSNVQNEDSIFDEHTHNIYNTTTKDKNKSDIHIIQTRIKLETLAN